MSSNAQERPQERPAARGSARGPQERSGRRATAIRDSGADTNRHKADFDSAYSQPDPRAYFRTLMAWDYQVPQRAMPVLDTVLEASANDGRPRRMLDLCCSYGILSSLLYAPDGPRAVAGRYIDPAMDSLTSDDLARADAAWYAAGRQRAHIVGLDISAQATGYALKAGLLAEAWNEDLESNEPSRALVRGVRDVGLIVSTGGVGYVGVRTFRRLMQSLAEPEDLWLLIFVLRVFDYRDIVNLLDGFGLVTERLPTSFPQRRFVDAAEQTAAIRDVERRGLDATGKEAAGWFHADCYLTRPAAAVRRQPLHQLLPTAS